MALQDRNDELVDLLSPDFMPNDARQGNWHVLPDALLVAHYDGPMPYNTCFFGNPMGHRGQAPTVSGGVIYRPGKFGKAVQVAEATTNYCLSPSFEGTYAGGIAANWVAYTSGGGAGTRAESADALYGAKAQLITKTDGGAGNYGVAMVCGAQTYAGLWTISFYVKVLTYSAGAKIMCYADDGVAMAFAADTPITAAMVGVWTRVSVSSTVNWTSGRSLYLYPAVNTADASVLFDGYQAERLAYATPYCDGSLGPGHSWSGTAHASTSSRTAAVLRYPSSGNISPTAGTWAAWVYPQWSQGDSVAHQPVAQQYGADYFDINKFSDNKLYAGWQVGGVDKRVILAAGSYTLNAYAWNHLAVAWDTSTGVSTLYINGVSVGVPTTGLTANAATASELYIGSHFAPASQWNGLIDDLLIMPRAMSAAEVKALYDCGMPVSGGEGNAENAHYTVSCRVTMAAGWNLSNGSSEPLWDTELWDTAEMHSTAANQNRLTVTIPGLYLVQGHLRMEPATGGSRRSIQLYHQRGATITTLSTAEFAGAPLATTIPGLVVSTLFRAEVGDFFGFSVYQDTGGNLPAYGTQPYFEALRMGP